MKEQLSREAENIVISKKYSMFTRSQHGQDTFLKTASDMLAAKPELCKKKAKVFSSQKHLLQKAHTISKNCFNFLPKIIV